MFRLILDTALEYSYLALLNDDEILYESFDKGSNNHSETLMPKLEGVLNDNSISLRNVSEVYVGIGPGSYTGVRIAVVIGKMIAAMNNIKLYSFSSLALLASNKKEECYPFIDCRRGNCYTAHFVYENNKLIRTEEDKVVKIDEYFQNIDEEKIVKFSLPNANVIINDCSTLVEDTNALSPNYLQLVEAERIKMGLQ